MQAARWLVNGVAQLLTEYFLSNCGDMPKSVNHTLVLTVPVGHD